MDFIDGLLNLAGILAGIGDLFGERDDRPSLAERETPFWRMMMPVLIAVMLLLAGSAIVAWKLWHDGFLGQWGLP